MMSKLFCLAIIVAFFYWRQQRAKKPQPKVISEAFDGELYKIGASYIGVKNNPTATKTVLCIHGFMENMLYLEKLYKDEDIQLITLNNSGYHHPTDISDESIQQPEWAEQPPFKVGTIEYDAFILNQALANLPSCETIRIHGHSRGCAVVIEAAATRPDLHKNRKIEHVLEAPVLPYFFPGIASIIMLNPIAQILTPFSFAYLNSLPDKKRAKFFAKGRPGEKQTFLNQIFFNPSKFSVVDTNMTNLYTWAYKRPLSSLKDMPTCKIYIADNDTILNSNHMRKLAKNNDWLEPIECKGSHWLAFDTPEHFSLNQKTD